MRQFTVRTLLLGTTFIAIAFGFVAYDHARHLQAERVRLEEQQLIAQFDSTFTNASVFVAEPGVTFSAERSVIYLMPIGPKYPSLYSSDAYNRATTINLEGEIDVDTVQSLHKFQHLRAVWISVNSSRNGDLPIGFDELLLATIDFHERHPDVSLSLTCTDWSGDVIFDYP